MIECKHCKTLNKDDYVYCINCGRKLTKPATEEIGKSKSFVLNKKLVLIVAAALLLLAGGIYLLTRSAGKNDYYLSRNQVQYVDGDEGIYLFEGSTKKAKLPEVTADDMEYSFDNQILAIKDYTADTNDLYVYSNGKVDQVSNDVDRFELSDKGETLYYTTGEDGSVHLYQIKNKKDTVVFNTENEESFEKHVLSYSGKVMAYTTSADGETKLYVYNSSGSKLLPAHDVDSLLAVSEKGEVFYYDDQGILKVCDSKGSSKIIDSNVLVCANIDYSQLMAWGNEGFVLYENGRIHQGSYGDSGEFSNIVLPEKTLVTGFMNYSSGSIHNTFYHLGVSDLKNSYYVSEGTKIVRMNNSLKTETLCENMTSYLLSSDGKTLIWQDTDGNVHRFNGNSSSDFDRGEKRALKLCSWDDQNKILYFVNNEIELCYSDGKNVTFIEYNDPDIYVCGDDGYFYYKDGKTLKAIKKGGEIIEVGETNNSGSSYGKQNFYAKDGIGYQGSDQAFYFVKNAKATRLNTGENEENSLGISD